MQGRANRQPDIDARVIAMREKQLWLVAARGRRADGLVNIV